MASALRMINERGAPLIRGGIGYGTARMLARHCHGKKDAERIPATLAILGKVLPAAVALFHGDVQNGAGALALTALDGAGQGALDFLGVVHGLRDAREKKKVRAILVPEGADVKALPAGAMTDAELVGRRDEVCLGALGQAQPGASVSLDQLREIQTYR